MSPALLDASSWVFVLATPPFLDGSEPSVWGGTARSLCGAFSHVDHQSAGLLSPHYPPRPRSPCPESLCCLTVRLTSVPPLPSRVPYILSFLPDKQLGSLPPPPPTLTGPRRAGEQLTLIPASLPGSCDQIDCCVITGLVLKSPLLYSVTAPCEAVVLLATRTGQREAGKGFLYAKR